MEVFISIAKQPFALISQTVQLAMCLLRLVIIFGLILLHNSLCVIVVDDTMRPKKSSGSLYSVSIDQIGNKNGYYYRRPAAVGIEEVPETLATYNNENKYINSPDGYNSQLRQDHILQAIVMTNPLLAALLLTQSLHISPEVHGYNSLNHLTVNPYVSLLLSHYGRYINPPRHNQRGIYAYAASNNYHNNQPIGAYKIYEETRK